MREILFRGKRVDNGEWIEGCYVNCHGPGCSVRETKHYIIEYSGTWHEIYTSTVGQCTGLTDKNGKKIFEGDIVRAQFKSNRSIQSFIVSFFEGLYVFDNNSIKVSARDINILKVIRNVYDEEIH